MSLTVVQYAIGTVLNQIWEEDFLGFSYGFRPGRGQHDALDALWVGTWLAPLKGFTAYRANELLGSYGEAFWHDESYDHLVRSPTEFDRIRAYIGRTR